MADSSTDDLLTSEQAARLLGVSARTVRRMAVAGLLRPVHRLPGRSGAFLYLRADVERARTTRGKATR